MPAFLNLGVIQGDSEDPNHKDWIRIESMTAAILHSITGTSAKTGEPIEKPLLGDIVLHRQLDKASVKIAEACAVGKHFDEVEIHLCSTIAGNLGPYFKYRLKNVIVVNYILQVVCGGDLPPSEELGLRYKSVEWNYIVRDQHTGDTKGVVPGRYNCLSNSGG